MYCNQFVVAQLNFRDSDSKMKKWYVSIGSKKYCKQISAEPCKEEFY